MKKFHYLWILLVFAWGCSDGPTGASEEPVEASVQKQFVWNAMNYWYYWQAEVPDLADDRFASDQDFQGYLRDFSDARSLFNSLLYEQDDFSFFIPNYKEFQQSRQGISKSFGFQYGLVQLSNSNDLFGYVQYILPDSPAEEVGLVRGELFTRVDGIQLTISNYQDLLRNRESYELSLAEINNNTISETGETVALQAVTLQEDPVFLSSVLDTASTKVGYLMYNSFQTNSHQRLNDVFGTFKTENVDELVLDLRYNGGGTGITSQILSSLVSGIDSSNVFAEYTFNEKRSDNDTPVYFWEEVPIYNDQGERESTAPMNQLSLKRLYVLTGFGTASASEVLINGLKPYMEVVLIGRQTVGKDEGSYTLYDAPPPYLGSENANPDHNIAIQPIVIKVVNRDGQGYPDGFVPDHPVNEVNYLEGGLPPLGDTNDPLLAKALELITGNQQMARTAVRGIDSFPGKSFIDSRDLQPYGKGLYLEPIGLGIFAVE